ncbi:hypothetical protein ACVJGD_008712 [Bradyrhizobium sp. USDA 10063]
MAEKESNLQHYFTSSQQTSLRQRARNPSYAVERLMAAEFNR